MSAAVDKIKEMRKPEDFIGHRKRNAVLITPQQESSLPVAIGNTFSLPLPYPDRIIVA